jgi:hypothetical protein
MFRGPGPLLLAVVTALLATGTALAGAGGAGTVSTTEHFRNVVIDDHEAVTNPCTGEDGTITLLLINGVSHLTVNGNGFWSTFTAEGEATFEPNGGSAVGGHFTSWDGENGNLRNGTATATFTVHISGLTMHETAHWNVSASGIGGVEFDKPVLACH